MPFTPVSIIMKGFSVLVSMGHSSGVSNSISASFSASFKWVGLVRLSGLACLRSVSSNQLVAFIPTSAAISGVFNAS